MPFLIETEVKLSNIDNAGNGRYFLEDCDKDTIIRTQIIGSVELYKFMDEKNLEVLNMDHLQTYGHSVPIEYEYDYENMILLNDPPLFTNHSKNPNIYFIYKNDIKYTLTSIDVKKGDEMYQDYTLYKKIDWYENYLKNNNRKSLRTFGNEINVL